MITPLSVLIRCDGSSELGLGHVVRCLAIADELRDRHGCIVAFAMRAGELGMQRVRGAGYAVVGAPAAAGSMYADWLRESVAAVEAGALVLDVRDELSRADVAAVRDMTDVTVATIDDGSDRRLAADVSFLPPVPQALRLTWDGARGDARIGWEWIALRREFAEARHADTTALPARVLVTMGGSDPLGLTPRVIEALDLLGGEFETVVALGPGFEHQAELEQALQRTHREFSVVRDGDLVALMRHSTLAIAAFGVTAYELAALGVPAIHLSLTEDHAESASALVNAGIAVSLGIGTAVSATEIAIATNALLVDDTVRNDMSRRSTCLVDGRGAARIADDVAIRLRAHG